MRTALVLTAILLICLAAMAAADTTNWTLGIYGSADGFMGDRWNVIGAWSTYTDAINSSAILFGNKPPGIEGSQPPQGIGKWIAVRQTTTPIGQIDMRAKLPEHLGVLATWTMNIYYYTVQATEPLVPGSITLTIKPDVDKTGTAISGVAGDLPSIYFAEQYEYLFRLNSGPTTIYTASQLNTLGSLALTIATPHDISAPDTLTVTVRLTPEPGSLLALGGGLAGLVAMRRFRKR